MTLRHVRVTNFRCLQAADVEFDAHFTLLSGINASGKTSVLEAIYMLGRGRSFRTRKLDNVIRTGTPAFSVFGEVVRGGRFIALGVEGSKNGIRAKMDGDVVPSLAELAVILPAQIIDPEVHRLIEEGPAERRRFLDWGVFHVEHNFLSNWRNYQHVLRQRNAALRGHLSREAISAWDGEMIRLGNLVTSARSRYVSDLEPAAVRVAERLLGLKLGLSYRQGWKSGETLATALHMSYAQDVAFGSTSVGPQRADLSLRLEGQPVKDRISRGQQKLLAAALLMAQISLFPRGSDARPVLLLDDPAAELDVERLSGLIAEVIDQGVQLIVTTLNPEFLALGTPGLRYLIKAGEIHPD